ncbi:MAG TPA: signal recognition particle protein [bacterium]|nr:signal recognition particle protein [bacterium]
MFEQLQNRLGGVLNRLRGRGALSEADVDQALREIRLVLLEADVNVKIARDFTARVRETAMGQEVWKSLTPGQQVVQIVHAELVRLLGESHRPLQPAPHPPTVILLAGLHGTGKTTTAGKLAAHLKKRGRQPVLAAADLSRPAAVRQVEIVAGRAQVPVVIPEAGDDAVAVARRALAVCRERAADTLIVDSAGRLHVDDDLVAELARMRDAVAPHYTLLVLDAMAGQDAVRMAEGFHRAVPLDGVILTKLDGDARGGAALSVVATLGVPIFYVGTGERLDALEPFHPDRMASRILGMGDVLTLIEKAQEQVTADEARELERKVRRAELTLEDFTKQLRQVRAMGPLDQVLGMIPGFNARRAGLPAAGEFDERALGRIEAMISSMTPAERRHPEVIDGSRRRRIARGSGTSVQEVNRLLRQFTDAKKMLKQIESMGRRAGRLGKLPTSLEP